MKLSCMDLDPNINCDFEAWGKSESEVAQKMMEHLKKTHPEQVEKMKMNDDEILAMLESKVHE